MARANGVDWIRVNGTKHEKWKFNGTVIMIPRHSEIGEKLSATILRQCERAL